MRSIDPSTGLLLREYPEHDDAELEQRIARAQHAFQAWRKVDVRARAALLTAVALRLEAERDALARLATAEMGKPRAQARAEIEKCARTCRHFAEHGAAFLAPETVATEADRSFVVFEPLGLVLAVLPWNFPYFQLFRFAVPAVMAGNAVIFKPAPSVCGCAEAIEAVWREAGASEGLVSAVRVHEDRVAGVIADRRVAAVTLTGSPRAGRSVARLAGAELKKVVLELGGSDPYVITANADLGLAVDETVKSRILNAGQSCIGAKRCLVDERVADRFRELLLERLRAIHAGDPHDDATALGPMARVDLRDALHDQVVRSVALGAELVLGGERPERPGAWYPPTVLDGVRPGMPAFDEELFGPVFTITRVRDEAEAIALANQSEYGLGAAVFTRDFERGLDLAAHALEAGSCFVNAFVRSDPRLPFGGIKHSGFGRELSRYGLLEFVNVKTVYAVRGPASSG